MPGLRSPPPGGERDPEGGGRTEQKARIIRQLTDDAPFYFYVPLVSKLSRCP